MWAGERDVRGEWNLGIGIRANLGPGQGVSPSEVSRAVVSSDLADRGDDRGDSGCTDSVPERAEG